MAWGKESRQSRGYDAAWEKTRKAVLDAACWQCKCPQCRVALVPLPANEVDHIFPKAKAKRLGWTRAQMDAPSNLQAINSDCHKRKTQEDEGKTFKPKVRIGIDGFPVE